MRNTLLMALLVLLSSAPTWARPAPAGDEYQINALPAGEQTMPVITRDASGTLLAAWQKLSGTGDDFDIYSRRLDGTGGPLWPFDLKANDSTAFFFGGPAVAALPGGRFVLAWTRKGANPRDEDVVARLFDETGAALTAEIQVSTFGASRQMAPSVAPDPAGGFVVVWTSTGQDGSGQGVFGRAFDASGSPTSGEFEVNRHTRGYQNNPAVATDAAGNIVVVWSGWRQDGDGSGIFGKRFDRTGTPLGRGFRVNTMTESHQREPALAVDPSGNFVVVWTSFASGDAPHGIFGRRFSRSGRPRDAREFPISSRRSLREREPAVAADGAGTFVVAWSAYEPYPGGYGTYARRFDMAGAPLGREFQVNVGTTNYQRRPAVSAEPDSGFTVVWQSWPQDGSGYGIFGRRYSCPDLDGNGSCEPDGLTSTGHVGPDHVECRGRRAGAPSFTWYPGDYDRYRVVMSADPAFGPGTRVTSGADLLKSPSYKPSVETWRRACALVLDADPVSPYLYVRVFGVDRDLPPEDPFRKTYGEVKRFNVLLQ